MVKEGYKQTDVGVIPEGWEVISLQEACREPITYGIVQCGPHIKDGVPYVRVSDMDGPELDVNQMLRTAPSIAAKFSRSTVQEGDLVYALRGKLGEVRLVDRAVAGANLTQGTARLSPNLQIASSYLLWAMRSSYAVKQAEVESKGTTFREITLANLRDIKIPIPSPEEQRAIATALSDVDALIAALDQLIAKQRHLKTATMQQLLTGKKRLPRRMDNGELIINNNGNPVMFGPSMDNCQVSIDNYQLPKGYKQTEVGVIPEDWEALQVEQLARYITVGFVGSMASLFVEEGIPLLRGQNIFPNHLELTNLKYISSETHRKWSKSELLPGDVVIVRVGYPGTACVIPEDASELNAASLVIVRPDQGSLIPEYLSYTLNSHWGKKQIFNLLVGGAQQVFNTKTAADFTIPVPSVEEQRAIATVLSDMDGAIAALEARRAKTQAIKQGMMQQLLTGKVRLLDEGIDN